MVKEAYRIKMVSTADSHIALCLVLCITDLRHLRAVYSCLSVTLSISLLCGCPRF